MSRVIALFFCWAGIAASFGAAAVKTADYETSIVQMEVSRKQYDFVQPWTKKVDQLQKVGLLLGRIGGHVRPRLNPESVIFPPDNSANIFAKIGMTQIINTAITTTATPPIAAG